MSAPGDTFLTTAAIGNREDLTDFITRISPTSTPFMSMCSKTSADATLHEWQTQDLAPAAANAQAEGDDAVNKTVTPTVRLTNRTQISTKTVQVSGTQQAVKSAGRKNEMGYQRTLASLETKRDMEYDMTHNDVLATSPRKSRGLPGWVIDNVSKDAGTTLAAYVANTGRTEGATRAFSESLLKGVLQLVYTAGGEPDTVMMSPAAKQTFSSFSGNATRMDKSEDQKLYTAIDVYVSDFGELKAVPNRFQDVNDVFVLESSKWAIAYLRPFFNKPLALVGDTEREMIGVEYTLEAKAPKANGAVYDIA